MFGNVEMAESDGIQEVVKQAAIQAAVVIMLLRGVDAGPYLAPTAKLREPQQQRHGGLALEKPSFNWNAQDRYVELLNFEIEKAKILEKKRHMDLLTKKRS